MRSMGTCVFVALLACVALVRADQAPQQQAQPPQFRASVDLTRLDVTVLDERTRKPIRGLTADEFVVKVGGDVQRVATMAEVEVPTGPSDEPSAFVEAAHEIARNSTTRPRLFVIVMNDAQGSNDPFERKTGKAIAHRVVDHLGPDDLAAVVFYVHNQHAQDFTTDRAALRRAIETFNPMDFPGGNALRRSAKFLAGMRGYRRAIVYISAMIKPHGAMSAVGIERLGPPSLPTVETPGGDDWRALVGTGAESWLSHIPIYPFSTAGLRAPTARNLLMGRLTNIGHVRTEDVLRSVADMSGGRVIAGHNAPSNEVPSVFEELSSYYTLGYEPTYPLDGEMRWLQVSVTRPGTVVLPNNVPFTTPRSLAGTARTALGPERSSGLVAVLESPVPTGDIPLRLTHLPIAQRGQREQMLALTLGLPPLEGKAGQFRATVMIFDGEGRRRLLTQTQDVTLSGDFTRSASGTDVAIPLPLPPRRYAVRVFVERTDTEPAMAGSVYSTVTIPDFARAPLSLSGVAISHAAAGPVAGREALEGVLPFAPTTTRAFLRTDQVSAYFRIHQAAGRRLGNVLLDTEILDQSGDIVFAETRSIDAGRFSDGAGVEHRHNLPLSTLEPGEYLLRFVATVGEHREQRDVRFSVK